MLINTTKKLGSRTIAKLNDPVFLNTVEQIEKLHRQNLTFPEIDQILFDDNYDHECGNPETKSRAWHMARRNLAGRIASQLVMS